MNTNYYPYLEMLVTQWIPSFTLITLFHTMEPIIDLSLVTRIV